MSALQFTAARPLHWLLITIVLCWFAPGSNGNLRAAESGAFTKNEPEYEFKAWLSPEVAAPGQIVKLSVQVTPKQDRHTYPMLKQQLLLTDGSRGPGTSLSFPEGTWYKPIWDTAQETPEAREGSYEGEQLLAHEKSVTWSVDIWISDGAKAGEKKLEVELEGQVCARTCVPLPAEIKLDITVAGKPVQPSADLQTRLKAPFKYRDASDSGNPPAPVNPTITPSTETKQTRTLINAASAEEYQNWMAELAEELKDTAPAQTDNAGGLSFLIAGIFWGFISLITPCVFPMIPITVSYFLKQSEKTHHRPITMALVYCSTIVVVMTIAAVSLLSFFQWVSQNGYTNLGIGLLFIAFALSLFGMYELELPNFIAQWTASKESKGGLVGTVFMALTFTILSFACVAPFLGGFGGTAASGQFNFFQRLLGGLAFAITFASPFFLLALFPSMLRKMPKSGTWLNSVKVVMGFLELAAAFKFLRLGEMLLTEHGVSIFTYDLVLGLWIALAILCALYLLNFYRLPHDTPIENLGVLRVLLAGVFMCLALYMLPALFKYSSEGQQQRPNGAIYAWIDSFLLPEPDTNGKLVWSGNLKQVVADARKATGQTGTTRILLDMTGESCTNCRYNENNVFTKPEIAKLMAKYKLVQLYTDVVPENFYASAVDLNRRRSDAKRANYGFEDKVFKSVQLPLYAVLSVEENRLKVVAKYEVGKINDVEEFGSFLRDNLGSER